ncbi:redoxin domain-containing protein [Halorhabdus amylolytica]|uniref:redoxin domain-containing protein n=1 Tax=Halorhabdus amylolytica TaxID=2559573 RepID=UPI0010AB206E|nr:redoxin domain-containing protein [Halorhabdus amylolytica]
MLQVGEDALTFELPAVVESEIQQIDLGEYLGEEIVVLVFYPGDFNPACGEDSDLEELDLFTMQPDVTVIGVAPDTLYSHRRFAEAYDLAIPLAADTRGEVAAAYEVDHEDEHGQSVPERAVFVVDLDGTIQYAWSTRDPLQLPDSEAIQRAVGDIGGDAAAVSRYRVGHAHYVEGRRGFTSAMSAFREHEWMVARSDFERAREEFTTAAEQFATAGRFVGHAELADHFERARLKANALWQAADWLADAADAFASGDGEEGNAYRSDAENPLETARDLAEPLDPDDITVDDRTVSIDADALAEADTVSAMEAIRAEFDGEEAAGGVELELDAVSLDDDGEDLPDRDGPDTDAAKRIREYAGVGMDISDPEGAGDDQIADALAAADEADDPADGTDAAPSEAGRPETSLDDVPEQSHPDETAAGDRPAEQGEGAGRDSAAAEDSAAGDDSAASEGDAADAETDVTEEEIEEIAEELQSQNGEERQS